METLNLAPVKVDILGRDVGGYGMDHSPTGHHIPSAMDMIGFATTTLAHLSGINEATIIANIPALEKASYQKKLDIISKDKRLFRLYQQQVQESKYRTNLGARAELVKFTEALLAEDRKDKVEIPNLFSKLSIRKNETVKHPISPTRSPPSTNESKRNLSPLSNTSDSSARKYSFFSSGFSKQKSAEDASTTDSSTNTVTSEGHPLIPNLDHDSEVMTMS